MEKIPNFHEVSEKRKELRKTANELGGEGVIFEKHYKKPLEETQRQASQFKMADFGGLKGAKEILKKQKAEYKEEAPDGRAHIDYEAILQATPKIGEMQEAMEKIADLKNFRMRRMFEILSPETSLTVKKRNEAVLKTIKEEIKAGEEKLQEADPIILRQTELIKHKEDLAKSGHICITPSVEKYFDAIGDRMLTGKPMFLHGPTGTGKTSLARFAATHFTGNDPEMVFCNPQTKESNVWGKTAISAQRNNKGELTGAIFTYLEFGPLARALREGKTIIFDEFTALPKEQMVFIKAVFALKPGDKVNVAGDGMIKVASGFQAIFTANLKSEKNPERQDLPPEIAREFEQNNLEIKYTSSDEAYDIMLSRLLNRDGSLDMSFYDLNTTLPNLCKVMAEIQESYTNETDKEVARRAGALPASGKVYSLKKFVMTQGSVEAILSSWLIEKQTGKSERSFAEFLDERFMTALTFKEYSKEDRILAAKILASKGFLLTLTAKDLDLPEDIFKLNTIKQMRGADAVEELRKESGTVKHLTLKEVAEFDPFGKRAELLKNRAEALLGAENGEEDQFLGNLNKRMGKIFGEKKKNQTSEISVGYTYTNPKTNKVEHQETITLNIESELEDFLSFYQDTDVDLLANFEDTARDIWERNQTEIEQAIEQDGFDGILIVPGGIPLPDLAEKMKMENCYFTGSDFDDGGGFAGAVSQNIDKPHLILYHKTETLEEISQKTGLDVHLNITGREAKKLYQQNPDQYLSTLEDFLILERKYLKDTGKHLSDWNKKSAHWLPGTKSGARLVHSDWDPGPHKLDVDAGDLGYQRGNLGVRPARCFF